MSDVLTAKTCSKCGEQKALDSFNRNRTTGDGYASRCKECKQAEDQAYKAAHRERQNEHNRAYRQRHPDVGKAWRRRYYAQNRLVQRAHNRLNGAIRDGRVIPPENCEGCGKQGSVHGHHEDYSRPLDVEWLCPGCHAARHKER